MKVLALETTGKFGSAAVIDDDGVVSCAVSSGEMNHLTDIIKLIDKCLNEQGVAKSEVTHVAASIGPGSFTGIRIGVSTARALSQSLGIPCISVRTLEAMMFGAVDCLVTEGLPECGIDALDGNVDVIRSGLYICTIINARRHQTYGALWKLELNEYGETGYEGAGSDDTDYVIKEILPQAQYMIEDILEKTGTLDGTVVFTGDGIDAYESIILADKGAGYVLMPERVRYQSAEAVARIALGKAACGEVLNYEELMPDYMRKSEAEMRLEEGTLSSRIKG